MGPFTIPGGNPVTELSVLGVKPRSPSITVKPVLVTVARAKTSKPAAAPRFNGERPAVEPVVKLHGFGTRPAASALPSRSLAPVVTVAVNESPAVRALAGVNVTIHFAAL